jgi:rubredoxin
MKRRLQCMKWLPLVLPLAAVCFLLLPDNRKCPTGVRMKEVGNNPDKFYLRATNSAYDCRYIYDPRAADEWLFHTGGLAVTNRP